jgi:hypothetical protein
MRLSRVLATLGLAAALTLPAATAAAEQQQHVGLHDMKCSSIMAMGKGMPEDATLRLTLVNRDNGTTLARQTVQTSAKGAFEVRMHARINQVLSMRLLVDRMDGTKVGFADHVMARGAPMCNLPFTGPSRTPPLLLAGSGALVLGLLLVVAATRRERAAGRAAEREQQRYRLPWRS